MGLRTGTNGKYGGHVCRRVVLRAKRQRDIVAITDVKFAETDRFTWIDANAEALIERMCRDWWLRTFNRQKIVLQFAVEFYSKIANN
jgi:hypothetical protein